MRVGSIVTTEVFHIQPHHSTLDNGTAMSSFSDDNDTAKSCLNSERHRKGMYGVTQGVLNDYRWTNCLAVVWFGSLPYPPPPPPPSPTVSKLSLFLSLHACVAGRAYWRERGREKAWSSINHPILSGVPAKNSIYVSNFSYLYELNMRNCALYSIAAILLCVECVCGWVCLYMRGRGYNTQYGHGVSNMTDDGEIRSNLLPSLYYGGRGASE